MDGLPAISIVLLLLVCRVASDAVCNTKFSDASFTKNFGFTSSSESIKNKATEAFTVGWCAGITNNPSIDVDLKQPYGIKSIVIAGPTNVVGDPYPTNVLVKYVPNGGAENTTFIDFPLQEGKLEIKMTQLGTSTNNFITGIAARKLQFIIQSHHGSDACLKIDLIGCTVNDLCTGTCQNGGVCKYQESCQCAGGFLGKHCELKACVPIGLGLASGTIDADHVHVSTQDPANTKTEIGNSEGKKGWCPLAADKSPWVQITLDQPMAISVFSFNFSDTGNTMIMTEFELQYIAPIDSARRFRTFATDIPALNTTHSFTVTIHPEVITDTIRVIPTMWDTRACFKLEINGCDPKELCSTAWCMNNGTCMGKNACLCPVGFFGDRCEQTKTDIKLTSLHFVNITQNVITTSTLNLQFLVTGNVKFEVMNGTSSVRITGPNSYIKLNPTSGTPSCVTDVNHCNNGFTFTLDVKFDHIVDNTFIVSSGGNLPHYSGITLYYAHQQLHYIVSTTTQQWILTVNYRPLLHQMQRYEITWNKHLGVELLVNGHSLGSNSRPSSHSSTKVTYLCIGCSHSAISVNVSMQVTAITTWSIDRTELVNAGIKEPSATATTPITNTPSTTPTTTVARITTAAVSTTKAATTTQIATTPTTTTPSTTTPSTTTQIPVPTYTWNFATTTSTVNTIIGNHYNLTVHGKPGILNGAIHINSSTQYIEFGSHPNNCLTKPETCSHGLTIRFKIQINKYEENTYFLTSGGQLPDGVGIAVIYRFGKIQFILTTVTQSWFIMCRKSQIPRNTYHTIMMSWHLKTGLEVFVNNVLIETNKGLNPHQSALVNTTNVYFGKQPTSSIKVEFLLSTITIWHVTIDILVEQGKCEPPVRPTSKPTAGMTLTTSTKASTTPPATTPKVTMTSLLTKSSAQPQCPAGCVSVVTATTSPTSTPNPTTTGFLTPTPDTATPPPPTTRKPVPDFNVLPTVHVTVEKDKNAYVACVFTPSSQKDVQIMATLLVDGKIVIARTVSGTTGVAMFEVIQIDMFLFQKQIKCSIRAHYIGSSLMTTTFYSNILVPHITVTPGRLIVVEGHSKEFVTVTSTAPPQFYCCSGCKGQCQIHIVGSFHYERHFQKCGKRVIAQAVVESTKPPNFDEHICGYALTVDNWDQGNKIQIKAIIDGRRDGDHRNTLDIVANVYNQPQTAQITVKPNSFTVSSVQVTVKDNDHSPSQCKSVNDPHMTTFDGQRYNNMDDGEFILYRHKYLPFEVRALYQKCSSRSHATCNCAVAVKSGDDIIAVTGCQGSVSGGHPGHGHGLGSIFQQFFGHHGHGHGHGHNHNNGLAKTPMTIQIYKNGELTPGTYIRRLGCGQKYEIELPTGMVVMVQQSWKPFINIWIQASSLDRGKTEGLCGNFDGHRGNDLTPNVHSFINHWKAPSSYFFSGVGVSSHTVTSMYCSCVKDKNRVCVPGLGAMRCSTSRYDITATLVQHAKLPILSRHKRQASTDAIIPTAMPTSNIPPDVNVMTYEEAEQMCYVTIMNSTVTKSCLPILSTNLTEQIDNCAHDYNATGNMQWATDALRDVVVDCVDAANTIRVANETGNMNVTDTLLIPDNIGKILDNLKVCIEDCGQNGKCTDGVCICDPGHSGVTCDISKDTTPTVISVPFLCDVIDTSDCMAAPIYGDNFVESAELICNFEYLQIGDQLVPTGESGHSRAVYISLNQVTCPLSRLQSARISVSNDGGRTHSNDSTIHVVYSPVCYECTTTPSCSRKENTCLISGVCYEEAARRAGDKCQICRPVSNSSEWSQNNIAECVATPAAQVKSNEEEKKQILILAIVCGVLGAILIIGIIYCIRVTMGKKSPKGEFGAYDVADSQKLHKDPYMTAAHNPTYNERL